MGMKLHDLTAPLYGPENGTVAVLTGMRAQESPRRLQAVTKRERDNYIAVPTDGYVYHCKPVYDWKVTDIWRAAELLGWDYNRAYDIQAMLGTSPGMQRVTPPFGEEPLNGLWKYAQGWPELWEKMLNRVEGVGTAGRYALTDLYGAALKDPPPGMTWQEWTMSLIDLYPSRERAEIANNISACIKIHQRKTKRSIPDNEYDVHTGLSWKSMAQMVARGDLKGRKRGQMVQRAMDTMAKKKITFAEVLATEIADSEDTL
jgi:predicted phosphoadenosine phosphosulfate sulfurtransferase